MPDHYTRQLAEALKGNILFSSKLIHNVAYVCYVLYSVCIKTRKALILCHKKCWLHDADQPCNSKQTP
jgi:hypothetical protein